MASSVNAEKQPRAYMLELPAGLLQQIAEKCSDGTLVSLRLTCKQIEAATLEIWAEEYVSRLDCFMLNPARLLRVKVI